MQKPKVLNLGHSDFKDVIQNNHYYIDKSLLIEEVIDAQKAVLLLPRPRRFGKTLNLSMLKYFFDIQEPENEILFRELNIWKSTDDIKAKRGKYPVMYLSFKDAKKNSWEDTLKHIKIEIAKLYRSHIYLLKKDLLLEIEKKEFTEILERKADDIDVEISLKNLSEYLYRYYQQQVVILIDEYDTPIQAGYQKFYDLAISFMRNLMLGAFKDNKFLYKGIITGILRVSKESIFTGLNNVSAYTILDHKFSDKFGFTEAEIQQIIHDFKIPTDQQQIRQWYNGYTFGRTENIYNPWSILNFALEYSEGFKTFWANTSSDELIKTWLERRDANFTRAEFLKLINEESIEKEINENFVFPDLDKDNELLWTLLMYSGYLTIKKKVSRKKYEILIPNFEVKTVFQDIILNWLNTNLRLRRTLLEDTTRYLVNNEIEKFEQGFKQIIGDTFSYFDTANEPEYVYQSYVLGLLAIIGDEYIIKSNRESGEGRYDILLIPHDKHKYGVVIEIKQIKIRDGESEETLSSRINHKISEALNQINKHKYYQELLAHKVSNIIKIPIVFAGKIPHIIPQSGNSI